MIALASEFAPHCEAMADSRDRDSWLRARRGVLGASEVASVLGLSPWAPAIELWARKTSRYDEAPDEVTEPMMLGIELEDWLLGALSRRTQCDVRPAGKLLRSKRWPHLAATLDGTVEGKRGTPLAFVAGKTGVVEVKSAGGGFSDQWFASSDGGEAYVPPWYLCQVDAQLAVTGAPFAVFGALLGGRGFRFRWTVVERHEGRIRDVVERTAAWWAEHVVADVPPDPDGSERAGDVIGDLFPELGGVVPLDDDAAEAVRALMDLRDQAKAHEMAKRKADQLIRMAIGTASAGELPSGLEVRLQTIARKSSASDRERALESVVRTMLDHQAVTPAVLEAAVAALGVPQKVTEYRKLVLPKEG